MENGIKEDSSEQVITHNKKHARRSVGRIIEVTILTVVIAAVWGLFSLPTVFFFMDKKGNSMTNSLDSSPTCTPEVYTGQFCRDALLSRQQCIPGRENTTEIYIQSEFLGGLFQDQTQIEMLLSNFQSFIQFEPSPECLEMLIPFLCSNILALCSDTGQLHLPLEQKCVSLRDGICMQEWQEITNLQQGLAFLPDCETLPGPSMSSLCQNVPSETQNISNQSNGTKPTSPDPSQPDALNITCSPDFYLDTEAGYCKPECGQWKPFSDDAVLADTVLVIIGSVVGITGAILIVTISILKYRYMLRFPSILILYQSTSVALYLLSVLIGYMDTQTFLCPSQDTTESFGRSTPYCTLNGISLFYFGKQALIFWIAHIATLLWLIAFPFRAKRLESSGHLKIIHILVLIVAVVLPIAFIAAPLGTGGFSPFYYPATCVTKNSEVSYYALTLPDSILSAIGVSLLVLLFWVLIRKKWRNISTIILRKKHGTRKSLCADLCGISTIPATALIKVLISFLCYTFITLIGYAAGASQFKVQSQYTKELTEYFICESSGIMEDRVCERAFEALYSPLPQSLALFFVGTLYLGANFLYVINLKEMLFCIRKKTRRLSTIPTINTYSTPDV